MVQSGVTYTLSDNVENLTLTASGAINATGNTLNNVLTQWGKPPALPGSAGGADTVQTNVTLSATTANVEVLVLTGSGLINGTDNTLNNILSGNSANNTLTATTGNDVLQGDAGTDTLTDTTGGNNLLNGGRGRIPSMPAAARSSSSAVRVTIRSPPAPGPISSPLTAATGKMW